MTSEDRTIIQKILAKCSMDDLRELNGMVINIIRYKSTEIALTFRPGDKVSWVGKAGIPQTGSVLSIASKNVKVMTGGGVVWRVPPSLLKAEGKKG